MTRYRAILAAAVAASCVPGACERAAAPAQIARPLSASQTTTDSETGLRFYDASQLPIEGKGWAQTDQPFVRLPAHAKSKIPSGVWNLSRSAAGICVRFVTDSPTIGAEWDGGDGMVHMAYTGSTGLDLYRREGAEWVFCGVGRPKPKRTVQVIAKERPRQLTEYLLYLPSYHAVAQVKIGVADDARIGAPADSGQPKRAPVVFYGTSITQGGCASRAGMGHVMILGRWLDRETINLGFSGSGRMEMEMADLLNEIPASVYVLECLPNMKLEMVKERVDCLLYTSEAETV